MTRIRLIMTDLLYSDITNRALRAYYNVYNRLGFGFLEKVYENAMILELMEMNLFCERQKPIKVYYKNKVVGEYFADIMIENKIIIELKATEGLALEHELQLINYLKATELEVGLLFNFGKKPEFRRKYFTNDKKKSVHIRLIRIIRVPLLPLSPYACVPKTYASFPYPSHYPRSAKTSFPFVLTALCWFLFEEKPILF